MMETSTHWALKSSRSLSGLALRWGFAVALSGLTLSSALATPVPFGAYVGGACTNDSFTINTVSKSPLATGTTLYSGPAINSTKCVGLLHGNDVQSPYNAPNPNIGQLGDGLLNSQNNILATNWFQPPVGDPQSPYLDLDGNGTKTDPGWIFLGHEDRFASAGNNSSLTTDLYDKPLDLDSILKIKFNTGDQKQGTWSLETSMDIIEKVQAVLGRNAFDHLAFVIHGGGNRFAVYDFDFNLLSAGLPGFDYATPYSFTGTWNTEDFLNDKGVVQNVSGISIWARDPAPVPTNNVPEPATLSLLGLALLGLAAPQLRRRTGLG